MRNVITATIFIFISVLLLSCSAISKSQQSTIESFCTSAKTYAEFPKELVSTYSECLYKTAQLRAATNQDQTTMITDLDNASGAYFNTIQFNSELAISYQLLGKYFQALLDLVHADTSSLKANIGTLGVNVDSAASKLNQLKKYNIPLGFGDLAASIMQFIGKKRIKQQQLKYFQQFVAKGDPLVDSVSRVLTEVVLGNLVKGEIEKGNKNLGTTYKLYLANLDAGDKKASSFYGSLNPIYLQLKTCFAQSLVLVNMLAESTEYLKAAHKEMIAIIQSKQKKYPVKKIAAFNEKAIQLADLIKQFKSKN